MTANTLRLEAHERDGTTVVGTIRAGGLLRASRAFAEGAAARVVVSHLGPGMVRGDAFASSGRVAPGAHLIVAGQMATRVLSGPDPVINAARWVVERGARLDVIAEPTLVASGASYDARLALALEPGARAVVTELVRRERGAALRVAMHVMRGERCALADVLALGADDAEDAAIGTLTVFHAIGGDEPCLDALDREADLHDEVRIGIGRLRDGDVLVRITGRSAWAVREALDRLREALTTF
ncbi:MAG: UreD urease accessory protein [Candidatus Eremiobacteraeota bacterium]|nr:UreD urease accessory protein [Candidatus Eremiobacteraeota bacterium]